ncbi:hypothetical protein E3Q22_00489 [Wallemia mellicola]|uniref:ATPase expression protein 2, mitochondrial n=2 Tax=Wallemia mellicola TaxID=1708541 RepID=A0A4T0SGN0_9BASI|nr:hypothetical protein E3Q24_01293 [Wallemia mellicola]TIB82070.1 hypothetical protein E3Q22_00489 [Wallemia mellicola]TIB87752.1 hypothetical protein E3Q21_01253 [Wallemia mellicola]TIB90681.1 hypothetical protein E3Q20_01240 [Wallemia mellicola]TIB93740.1 hypothetical protein E3Q19_00853 [Wallemia mellicola]
MQADVVGVVLVAVLFVSFDSSSNKNLSSKSIKLFVSNSIKSSISGNKKQMPCSEIFSKISIVGSLLFINSPSSSPYLHQLSELLNKRDFYNLIKNFKHCDLPLHSLQQLELSSLNSQEKRRLLKLTSNIRPISRATLNLTTLLFNQLTNKNDKDIANLIHQYSHIRPYNMEEPLRLYRMSESDKHSLLALLEFAYKSNNDRLYFQLYNTIKIHQLEFNFKVVRIHIFKSHDKLQYINKLLRYMNNDYFDDGQKRHLWFKIIKLFCLDEISSYGNSLHNSISILDEWQRAYFDIPSAITKDTTHPIFSLSNYSGFHKINRPLSPAYLIIMQKAADLGDLTTCFKLLGDLVDVNSLTGKFTTNAITQAQLEKHDNRFNKLIIPLNAYLILYQACKNTSQRSISQRTDLLYKVHNYFIQQESFGIIKGDNVVPQDNRGNQVPSPNQILMILTTFLTITQNRQTVLEVWQQLRVKFRKQSSGWVGWNKVERYHRIRRLLYECKEYTS